MHNFMDAGDNERWSSIVGELGGRIDELVERFLARVSHVPSYSTEMVDVGDVRTTATESLRLLAESLAEGRAGGDLLHYAAALGEKRARQGIPPESLITAIRLDFSVVWTDLLEHCAPSDAVMLAGRVEHVWRVVDEYATQTHISYLAERVRMAQEESNYRQEFIVKLFGPAGRTVDVISQAAAALEVDPEGEFGIAAAIGPAARELQKQVSTFRVKGPFLYQSGNVTFMFWQPFSRPRSRVARGEPASTTPTIPCGLVQNVPGLRSLVAAAGTAAALAQISTEEDAGPLTIETGWRRLAREKLRESGLDLERELGLKLAQCREGERQRMEETIRAFMRSGSVTKTASELFCHRNTILNRLARFKDVTGFDLMVPEHAASIAIAWPT
ncbi:helix-turn-helix domain-containing protein [Arthrobacter sp. STN4]|uniref:helix-turn-helix domain-containing protein n=1 Tax=Arthrobacter sp. STN4 TaxID=2923276 RepID=UPI00211A88BA|nr:helix-turn-helix domain-containing protein [Arthrobacter sp. STN4]MCQ9164521.1 helix-turn-helix domain-containing protein [Arthrobacter sp. STN4]